jgi:hypothetical protein
MYWKLYELQYKDQEMHDTREARVDLTAEGPLSPGPEQV